jgi:hypothetical protein
MSISPTFYARIYGRKVLHVYFLCLHYRFELFLAQKYWLKCAHKMLVKLTIDVNANTLFMEMGYDVDSALRARALD